MNSPYFSLLAPETSSCTETPLIVEVPHAGLHVPASHMRGLVAPIRALGRDADLYVDELFAGAPGEGATLLVSHISRYVIDLNRGEGDIDADTVAGAPAGRAPRGLVWRLTTDGERAIDGPISKGEFELRVRAIYRPYHAALRAALDRKVARFGFAVLLAAHSMPSVGRSEHGDQGAPRADIVPGTRGRTSAEPRFIDAVDSHARAQGWSVAHDDPYKGGFVTQHYGRPAENIHAVQVELARRLYMDEATLQPLDRRFAATQHWCRALVAKLGQTALG